MKNLKYKLLAIVFFPAIVYVFMIGWTLYMIGENQKRENQNIRLRRRRKTDISYNKRDGASNQKRSRKKVRKKNQTTLQKNCQPLLRQNERRAPQKMDTKKPDTHTRHTRQRNDTLWHTTRTARQNRGPKRRMGMERLEPKILKTFTKIFDESYDNKNKICTRKSLLEQFKKINRDWLQQNPTF